MYDESVWIGTALLNLNKNNTLSPLLNVGSSTKQFREVEQKCIHENIFAPLEKGGVVVHHLDMKKEDGVDIVGDLTVAIFANDLTNIQSLLATLLHPFRPRIVHSHPL